MPHRIDIELTSARDGGTWTWRAAGAKQPRGTLDAAILYTGARVGDVVRAEAEFEIDGISVLSVQAPKTKRREAARIELIGPPPDAPGVTTELAAREPGRGDRPRRDRSDRRGSADRDG